MGEVSLETREKWIGKKVDVLDHGFVRLVDVMGSDDRVVQAARVSFGKGTDTPEKDRNLIDYLMRNGHTSPFEQVVTTWHVKMPIFVARQWVRHRTARLNEVSGRYSKLTEDVHLPEASALRPQSKTNRQGREDCGYSAEEAAEIREELSRAYVAARESYESVIAKHDLALELARLPLPVAQYTEMYWQMDLHNLFHFLGLRLDSHAQAEIRAYGEAMAEPVKEMFPWCWEAFAEHRLGAAKLSKTEVDVLRTSLAKVLELKEWMICSGEGGPHLRRLADAADPFLALSLSGGERASRKLADALGLDNPIARAPLTTPCDRA